MTGPHRAGTAQPEPLGFQSFGVGAAVAKRTSVPASPKPGAQASTGCSQPGSQPRARPPPVVSSRCWPLLSHFTGWNAEPRKHAWQASGHTGSGWRSRVSSGLSVSTCGDEGSRCHAAHECAIRTQGRHTCTHRFKHTRAHRCVYPHARAHKRTHTERHIPRSPRRR